MFLASFLSRAVFAMEDCACTGDNSLIPKDSAYYESGYGTSCGAWDASYDYCNVGEVSYNGGNGLFETPSDKTPANNWCSQPWCYVQKDCVVKERDWVKTEDISDTTDAKQTVVFKDENNEAVELYYSYLNCGSFSAGEIDWPDFEPCVPREHPIDVYFLVDGSSSIRSDEWGNQAFFLSQLIKTIDQEGSDRVGVVQFSGKPPVVENTFANSIADTAESVLGMNQLKGGTRTDEGIMKVLDQWKREDYSGEWSGEDRNKLFVIVTDGIPNPADQNPCLEANEKKNKIQERLKDMGVFTVIVAVGMSLEDRAILSCLVENPLMNFVVMDDFQSFDQYRDPTGSANLLCADPSTLLEVTRAPTNADTPAPSNADTPAPTNADTPAPTKAVTPAPSNAVTPSPVYVNKCTGEEKTKTVKKDKPKKVRTGGGRGGGSGSTREEKRCNKRSGCEFVGGECVEKAPRKEKSCRKHTQDECVKSNKCTAKFRKNDPTKPYLRCKRDM